MAVQERTKSMPVSKNGGAIGNYVDFWKLPEIYTDDRDYAFWRELDETYVKNGTSVIEKVKRDIGLRLKNEDIFNAMAQLHWHPISSCPHLARAIHASGTHAQLWTMAEHLQRALDAVAVTRATERYTAGFNIKSMRDMRKSAGIIPQCGPGFTAQFFKKVGVNDKQEPQYVPVSEEEAFVSRDGTLELASHVAREKVECVPRVTIAQIGGRAILDNLKFHPVIVPEVSRRPEDVRFEAPPSAFPATTKPDYSRQSGFQYTNRDPSAFGSLAEYMT